MVLAVSGDKKKKAKEVDGPDTGPVNDDPIVQARNAIPEKAMQRIETVGLMTPDRPKGADGAPRLPDDIDNLEDKELGYYLGIYARWCEYAEYIVAHADVKHALTASTHEFISAKVRLMKTGTVQDKSSKTHIDIRYQESLLGMESEFATLRLTKALLAGYQKIYEALSREITRRQNKIERTRGH